VAQVVERLHQALGSIPCTEKTKKQTSQKNDGYDYSFALLAASRPGSIPVSCPASSWTTPRASGYHAEVSRLQFRVPSKTRFKPCPSSAVLAPPGFRLASRRSRASVHVTALLSFCGRSGFLLSAPSSTTPGAGVPSRSALSLLLPLSLRTQARRQSHRPPHPPASFGGRCRVPGFAR
jgi:hypothetical protein